MNGKMEKFIVPLIVGLAVLVLIGFFAREALRVAKVPKIEKVKEKTKEEIPSAEHFVASGKQVYERITDKPRDPQIIEVEVDPLDVEIGKTQVVTVKVKTKADSVRAEDYVLGTAILDGNKIDFPLKLKKAEGKEELITTWQGKWERKFPIEKHYQIKIFVKNIKGEDEAILSFGSACVGVPVGGDYTIDSAATGGTGGCTFANTVDGVDNGNLTIAGPETCAPSGCQLTINAGQTIVWNPGKSVYVNGSIWINKPGGQLKKTYLWAADIDSDTYYIFVAQDSNPGGLSKRRSELTSWPSSFDCDDSTSTKYQNLTCYRDADGDGVVGSTASTVCCGSACGTGCTGWTGTAGTDCNDSDSARWQNRTCYYDGDNDGYRTTASATRCVGSDCTNSTDAYKRESTASTDCCDTSALVNSGATYQTATTTGDCGYGWDFNCNGTVEKQYTALGNGDPCINSCGDVTPGWASSVPDCGQSGLWYTGICKQIAPGECLPTTISKTQACH